MRSKQLPSIILHNDHARFNFPNFSTMETKIKWRWSLLLVLLSGAIMQFQGRSLKTALNPIGIVDLELADSIFELNALLANWDKDVVRLNIWIDFLFIVAYTFFFIQSIRLILAKHRFNWLQQLGKKLIVLAYLAAILDVVENILMLTSIMGHYSAGSVLATASIATLKFSIIAIILIYLIGSLFLTLKSKQSPS